MSLSSFDNFNTNISIIDQIVWSSNSSLYYQNVSSYGCSSVDGDCNVVLYDGIFWMYYSLMMDGEPVVIELFPWDRIDQGTIYSLYDAFDPKQPPCKADVGGNGNFTASITYCCKKYTYFTIPDNDPNPCLDLTGISTIYYVGSDIVGAMIQTKYVTTLQGINFTATAYLLPENGTFDISPDYVVGPSGDLTNPVSIFYGNGDYQVDMYLDVLYPNTYPLAYGQWINKLIRRNGLFMKNQSHPFTPDDSCLSFIPPTNYYGSGSQISLCCTRFQQPTKSSLMAEQKLEKIVENAKAKFNKNNPISMPQKKLSPPKKYKQPKQKN
uniref:Uncharacterized protein n=1 Tax=Panagrolaimus davidi TaxID=227884 RepID=A0A914Q9J2_9BILA